MTTLWNRVSCAAIQVRCRSNELSRLQGEARPVRGPRAQQHRGAGGTASPGGLPRLPGGVRVQRRPQAAGQELVRLRHRSARLSREASRAPELDRLLQAARLYLVTPDREPDDLFAIASAALRGGVEIVQLRRTTLARVGLLELAR